MQPVSAKNRVSSDTIEFQRRLFRFIRDRRYRLLYLHPFSPDDCHYLLAGRFLTVDLCAPPDMPRDLLCHQVVEQFYELISPRPAWTDWLGNGLFLIGCWAVLLWAVSKTWIAAPFRPVVVVCFAIQSIRARRKLRDWREWTRLRMQSATQPGGTGTAASGANSALTRRKGFDTSPRLGCCTATFRCCAGVAENRGDARFAALRGLAKLLYGNLLIPLSARAGASRDEAA
jgi:hypothetical protein